MSLLNVLQLAENERQHKQERNGNDKAQYNYSHRSIIMENLLVPYEAEAPEYHSQNNGDIIKQWISGFHGMFFATIFGWQNKEYWALNYAIIVMFSKAGAEFQSTCDFTAGCI